ncbi:MAG TPA: hypothetical protein PK762_08305 [Candidatus Kapabacteria bacterium]|nr:hypothetical protein [Candidatus Kapabacteria bacterium]
MSNITLSDFRKNTDEILSSKNLLDLSSENEQFLNRFDSSVNNVKEMFAEMDTAMNTTKEVVNNVSVLWECTLDTVKTVKEIDFLMKQMDVSLEKYLIDSNISLEKFRTNAPIVEKQLDNISNRIDKILDKALTIDSKKCEMVDLELRTKLITQVRDWSDHISSLLMKLMGI